MQAHFYTLSHNLSGEDAAEKVTSMLHEEQTDEYTDDKGKWKPLTVWAAKGYDTARLLANCAAKDRKPDHVFGEVFRVRTLEDGVKKVTSFGFTNKFNAQTAVPTGGAASSSSGTLAIADGRLSSSSASSSSSSSSSDRKKSKKSKKDKKDKKDKKSKKEQRKKDKKDKKNKNGKRSTDGPPKDISKSSRPRCCTYLGSLVAGPHNRHWFCNSSQATESLLDQSTRVCLISYIG
jgi:hypothetical protein